MSLSHISVSLGLPVPFTLSKHQWKTPRGRVNQKKKNMGATLPAGPTAQEEPRGGAGVRVWSVHAGHTCTWTRGQGTQALPRHSVLFCRRWQSAETATIRVPDGQSPRPALAAGAPGAWSPSRGGLEAWRRPWEPTEAHGRVPRDGGWAGGRRGAGGSWLLGVAVPSLPPVPCPSPAPTRPVGACAGSPLSVPLAGPGFGMRCEQKGADRL